MNTQKKQVYAYTRVYKLVGCQIERSTRDTQSNTHTHNTHVCSLEATLAATANCCCSTHTNTGQMTANPLSNRQNRRQDHNLVRAVRLWISWNIDDESDERKTLKDGSRSIDTTDENKSLIKKMKNNLNFYKNLQRIQGLIKKWLKKSFFSS